MGGRGFVLVFLISVCAPSPVRGDILHFKSGFAREGIVVERTESKVRLRTELGEVTFPPDVIERLDVAPDEQNAALERRWQQEKAEREAALLRARTSRREEELPQQPTAVTHGQNPSGSGTATIPPAVNRGGNTQRAPRADDPPGGVDEARASLPAVGRGRGTDLRHLLENIGIDLARKMVELVEREYPSFQQDLFRLVEEKHPTLESDLVAMVREKYPAALEEVHRLKVEGVREEKVRIIRQMDARYPAMRSDVLEVIQRRHPTLFGQVFELIGRKYPRLLIDLGKASFHVVAANQ